MVPRHHAIEASDFNDISSYYCFAIRKEDPVGTVHAHFAPDACDMLEGQLRDCENLDFLGGWNVKFIEVVQNSIPTTKEETLHIVTPKLTQLRDAKLAPFFIMFVQKDVPSPSIAMVTMDSRLYLRQLSCYKLPRNAALTANQFHDTTVRLVPWCSRRETKCNCNKLHKSNLSLELVLQVCVVEKNNIFKSVFSKCEGGHAPGQYTLWHLPACQNILVKEFNQRRVSIFGDLKYFTGRKDML